VTDASAGFAALVREPEAEIRLDLGALLIAAHAHPSLDVATRLAQLDELAASIEGDDGAAVADALFGTGGFAGNTVDYYDPANSYLDDVLDRKLGIPITLSVLMIEVGRRAGVALHGVGMPGHFLVGAGPPFGHGAGPPFGHGAGPYFDPFHGGVRLDAPACEQLFQRLQGGTEPFRAEYLAPVGPRAVLDRMLANLQHTLLARSPAAATWPTRLRLSFPDLHPARRRELAGLLGQLGQFAEAAAAFEELAVELEGTSGADEAARAAARLRARAN
jgi:regulator of sirC expression with transglutaminase-like and TPR domain